MDKRNIFAYRFVLRSFNHSARLFLLVGLIEGIFYSVWQLFFNLYILASGFDKEFLGWINSIPFMAALLLGIPLGVLSDRMGRKRAMLIGYSVCISGYLVILLSRSPISLVLASVFTGFGYNLFIISQAPFMMEVTDTTNRSHLFSYNFGINTIAGVFGSICAGQLPAIFASSFGIPVGGAEAYQTALLTSVILGSFAIIPLILLNDTHKREFLPRNLIQPINTLFRTKIIWQISITQLMMGFGAAILIPYMNVFFKEKFQISDQWLGLLFGISALVTGVSSILAPGIVKFLRGRIATVVATQTASLAFLILIGISPFSLLAGIGFVGRSMLMNMAYPLFSAFSMEQIPSFVQGSANSILNIAFTIGWVIGPILSGIIQEQYGFSPLFLVTFMLYGMATLLTWLFFKKYENSKVEPVAGVF